MTHLHMSDRAIARASGLSAKTIASIRGRSSDTTTRQSDVRIGRDGRVRPLSSVEGRRRAAEVILAHPTASLREVAQIAGISPATVSDVRKRLQLGQEPGGVHRNGPRPAPRVVEDPAILLNRLLRDPALRQKEAGRQLLRLLQQNAIAEQEWHHLRSAVPAHSGEMVVHLARKYAETWTGFAQALDERISGTSRLSG